MPQPSKINAPITYRDAQGTERSTTVSARIIEYVRSGLYFELACKSVGIHKDTGYEWRKRAGQLRIRAYGRNIEDVDATQHELECLAFSDAVEQAEAEAAAGNNLIAQRLIVGGIPQRRTTTKVKYETRIRNGQAVQVEVEREVTTVEETTLPDGAMLRWWFERRFMAFYGHKVELIEPQLSDEERADGLADSLENWLETQAAQQLASESAAQVRKRPARADAAVPAEPSPPPSEAKRPKRKRDDRGRIVDE